MIYVTSVGPMNGSAGLRAHLAIWTVRSVNRLSRAMGRGSGTVAGGRVGLRLDPDLLRTLSLGHSIILVSGTNGKTTTTSMTVAGWGGPVTTNDTGSNMPPGHVAAMVASRHERVVLEVDEAWLADVIATVTPKVVILLNLSRDQLDRANEVRQMAERLAGLGYVVLVPDVYYRSGDWAPFDMKNVFNDKAERQRLFGMIGSVTPAARRART